MLNERTEERGKLSSDPDNNTSEKRFRQDGILTPEVFLAQQALFNHYGHELPFVTRTVESSGLLITTPVKRVGLVMVPFAASAVVLAACASSRETATIVVSPEQVRPTATAAPGIRGLDPIATFVPDSPYAKDLNPIIDSLNKGENVSQEDKNKITEAVRAVNQPAAAQATAEAQKPTSTSEPTQSPEVKAAPCTILPQQYCDKVNLIRYKNAKGDIAWFVGVKKDIIPAGIPLSTPIPGSFRKATNDPTYAEIGDLVNDPTLTSFSFEGDLNFKNDHKAQVANVVAYVGSSGNTGRLEKLGLKDYQFIVTTSFKNSNGEWAPPEMHFEVFRQYLPNAPIVQAEFPSSALGDPTVAKNRYTVTFEDVPPPTHLSK